MDSDNIWTQKQNEITQVAYIYLRKLPTSGNVFVWRISSAKK